MGYLNLLLFWLPAAACLVLLLALRLAGELSIRGQIVIAAWFAAGFVLQATSGAGAGWLAGFLLQTVLALYLAVRWKTSA